MHERKRIILLGATGSIGQNTLKVLQAHADKLELVGIAGNSRYKELAEIAEAFQVKHVGLYDKGAYKEAQSSQCFSEDTQLYAGKEGLCELATLDAIDMVVVAVVGTAGLEPTLEAIKLGRQIGLASKEVLVKAGKFVMQAAREHKVDILPMDSEHNALFQCLEGDPIANVKRLLLTASGGPFLDRPIESLQSIRPEEALKHPNWSMGPKITVDSSTMANKGLELIEARWLFDMPAEQLDVVIHRQSIVHSMVEFVDGSFLGQLCPPSMTFPIQHVLFYPERAGATLESLDFTQAMQLDFEPVEPERFICFKLALEALKQDGTAPAVFNAANEVAVAAFLEERINYPQIADVIDHTLSSMESQEPETLDAVLEADTSARQTASHWIAKL